MRQASQEEAKSMPRRLKIQAAIVMTVFVLALLGLSRDSQDDRSHFQVGYVGGSFSEIRLKDAQIALEVWTTSVGQKLSSFTEKVSATIYRNLSEAEHDVKAKNVDLIVVGSLDYLELESKVGLDPILVGSSDGQIERPFILLTRKDKSIKQLSQLKAKTMLIETGGFGDIPIPLYWLETILLRDGLPRAETFFQNAKQVDKPSQAVLPVFFNQADACVVSERSYRTLFELNPQLSQEMDIVAESLPLLRGVICLRKGLDPERRESAISILAKMHTEPAGQQTLMIFHEEKLVPFLPAQLDNVRALLKDSGGWKGIRARFSP
jgi:ABC-type phosphate/phosphonate transport system substrate-binding protein